MTQCMFERVCVRERVCVCVVVLGTCRVSDVYTT